MSHMNSLKVPVILTNNQVRQAWSILDPTSQTSLQSKHLFFLFFFFLKTVQSNLWGQIIFKTLYLLFVFVICVVGQNDSLFC